VPWLPELFSAPVLQRLQDKWDHELVTVPFFDGLMTGELDAMVESFAGVPELHHPVRGRIRGIRAFSKFVTETREWLSQSGSSIEDLDHVIRGGRRGCGEVVLHVESGSGRVSFPVAIVSDKEPGGQIDELRMYYSSWPLTSRHANRPPLLQADPEVVESDIVAEYQRALSAGDIDATVAAFEPEGYVREPAGGDNVHRGPDGLRAFYQWLFSNGGGIPLEHCAFVEDEVACALEYNVVRWGQTELPPQAGIAVYVRGENGKLAAARIYDDVDPPLAATG
jgi:SnoaL-like domain